MLLVRFQEDISRKDIDLILYDSGISAEKVLIRHTNVWKLRVDLEKGQLADALRWVRGVPEVLSAQYDHTLQLRITPDDPQYPDQWNWENTGQNNGVVDADIDANEAWDISTGGYNALGYELAVGIVDGGCDTTHPDLLETSGTISMRSPEQ